MVTVLDDQFVTTFLGFVRCIYIYMIYNLLNIRNNPASMNCHRLFIQVVSPAILHSHVPHLECFELRMRGKPSYIIIPMLKGSQFCKTAIHWYLCCWNDICRNSDRDFEGQVCCDVFLGLLPGSREDVSPFPALS